jgi:hypothetical protein
MFTLEQIAQITLRAFNNSDRDKLSRVKASDMPVASIEIKRVFSVVISNTKKSMLSRSRSVTKVLGEPVDEQGKHV